MQGHQRLVPGHGGKQVVGLHQRQAELVRQQGRDPGAELRMRVQAGAHGRAAQRQGVHRAQRMAQAVAAQAELGHITAQLLAQGDGGGVLQVGAADLDDAGERLCLGGQGVAQGGQRRQQAAPGLQRHGDVHGAGERIIGRLPQVHLVVRMHRVLCRQAALQRLRGQVGHDLVHVHVALGARSGLPHGERKLRIELALGHAAGRIGDRLCGFGLEPPQVMVDTCCGPLDPGQRMHHLQWHGLLADREETQAQVSLRAPQMSGRRSRVMEHAPDGSAAPGRPSVRWRTPATLPCAQTADRLMPHAANNATGVHP